MSPPRDPYDDDLRESGAKLGPYEIVRRIAKGGMAEIFLANQMGDRGVTRRVVLKRILPSYTEDPEFLEMFLNEVRIVARLSHPNIAHVFDLGTAAGHHFIVMELVDGISLAQLLNRISPEPLPVGLAVEVASSLAQALYYAHEFGREEGERLGIVHRDVSPHNVLLSYDGQVKLVDFGIAKAADQGHRTETGVLKGKVAYMAPERLAGDPYDHRVDIFSLGILLFEMLTASRLFRRETLPQTVHALSREPIPKPSDRVEGLSPRLDAIVMRALARDPAVRYHGADELAIDLETYRRETGLAGNQILLGRHIRSILERRGELPEGCEGGGKEAPPAGLSRPWSGALPLPRELPSADQAPPWAGGTDWPAEHDRRRGVERDRKTPSSAVAPPGQPNGPGTPLPWPADAPTPTTPVHVDSDEASAWLVALGDEATPVSSAPLPSCYDDGAPTTPIPTDVAEAAAAEPGELHRVLVDEPLFPEAHRPPAPAPHLPEVPPSEGAPPPPLPAARGVAEALDDGAGDGAGRQIGEATPAEVELPSHRPSHPDEVGPQEGLESSGLVAGRRLAPVLLAATLVAAALVAVGGVAALLGGPLRDGGRSSAGVTAAALPSAAGLPPARQPAPPVLSKTGTLVVDVAARDVVEVDGVAVASGAALSGVELPAGSHLVEVRRPGREPWSVRTTVVAGAEIRLEPGAADAPDGVLVINSRPWSRVIVDGRAAGNTPVEDHRLRPGAHRVVLVARDGRRIERQVTIRSGERSRLNVAF